MQEEYAMIELLGRSQIVGKISEVTIAGKGFIRVAVMNVDDTVLFTRDINPDSVFAMNPITHEACLLHAKRIRQQPVVPYSIDPIFVSKLSSGEKAIEEIDTEEENEDWS